MAYIIVLEDDLTLAVSLRNALTDAGHTVMLANTVDAAMDVLDETLPDLVIADILIKDGNRLAARGGISLISHLSNWAMQGGPTIPIIAISGGFSAAVEIDALKMAGQMGAHYLLPKPFEADALVGLVARALTELPSQAHDPSQSAGGSHGAAATEDGDPEQARILVVEDDVGIALNLEHRLGALGHQVDLALTIEQGLACLDQADYHLVIADVYLPIRDAKDPPVPSGANLILRRTHLIQATRSKDIPVIVITGGLGGVAMKTEIIEATMSIGAVAGLQKPIDMDALLDLVATHLAVSDPYGVVSHAPQVG